MLSKQQQIFVHESLSAAQLGTTWTSPAIPYGNEPGWVLIIRNNAAASGTSPSMIWELDSNVGGTFTRIGAALSAISATGVTVVPYYTGTTQGAVPANTLQLQLKCTFNAADNVFPDVTVELIALD